jgi:CheY-like chemotaxis protein
VLPYGEPPRATEQPMLMFDFGEVVGLAVASIVDVVDVERAGVEREHSAYVAGRTVVFGKTTVILDAYAIVRKLAPAFVRPQTLGVPSASGRVMVVEDSQAMRAAVAEFLRRNGFDVTEVGSARQALELVSTGAAPLYDAVVTDLDMPDMDGITLTDVLRSRRPELPVIAFTSIADDTVLARARSAGAQACVHKLQRESLIDELRKSGLGAAGMAA